MPKPLENIEAAYPLSPMQQGMLFHTLESAGSGVYVEQTICTLRGELCVPAFEQAWQQTVQRHSILRTAFAWKGLEKPLQAVRRSVEIGMSQYDWRAMSAEERETARNSMLREDAATGFDLGKAPLMRLTLVRTGDDCYEFLWSHHHLLLDGWSVPLLLAEVLSLYDSIRQGAEVRLPRARPYRDYIDWVLKQDPQKAEAFWRKILAGFSEPTSWLNAPGPRPGEYEVAQAEIGESELWRLQALARAEGVTLNTVVQAAWGMLLARYSGQDDVVFGATVSGRPAELSGSDRMIGLFINTLPVRVNVGREDSVRTMLRRLQSEQTEVRQYEYTPLIEVVRYTDVPAGTALFDSLVVFENFPLDRSVWESRSDLRVEGVRTNEKTNFPVTLACEPARELTFKLLFDSSRLDRAAAVRVLGHLKSLLVSLPLSAETPVHDVEMLALSEHRQLSVWGRSATEFPSKKCIHELFEEQAERTPDAIAIESAEAIVTYSELNRRANQLARFLKDAGVGPEVLVGLCAERSTHAIVAMLGILKAGGAYVPLDPSYPAHRILYMATDADIKVLITDQRSRELIDRPGLKVVCLETEWPVISREIDSTVSSAATPQNAAYVIYTSGSTGQPKGTILAHRGVVNLAIAQGREFCLTVGSRVLQFASLSFDASVSEIFTALVTGATLYLAPHDRLAAVAELQRLLIEKGITAVTLPPSVLAVLDEQGLENVRTIIAAGEACSRELVSRWAPGRKLLNGYGPTEATVCASMAECDAAEDREPPIGRTLPNTILQVLDHRQRLVPVGVAGELYIGGEGLARGYVGRPDLTAERFIPDGRSADPGVRLYRTGDRVRWREDGQLEFLGRVDGQVKVRGYRVELGEIEAALKQNESVREAVVAVRKDNRGESVLTAYVAAEGPLINGTEIKRWLHERLPEYMVPTHVIVLNELPHLPNGKVDRRNLPREQCQVGGQKPITAVQQGIADVWRHVLGVEFVGLDDNFFELGGHSLKAMQVTWRIKETFGVDLQVREVLENARLQDLAGIVQARFTSSGGEETRSITRVPRSEEMPVSWAQQRLWFLEQLAPNSALYNNPAAVKLKGRLKLDVLERSFNDLVQRHEVLRTRIIERNGIPVSVIEPEMRVHLEVEDLVERAPSQCDGIASEKVRLAAQVPFDLAKGPLFRINLWRTAEDEHVALFNLHHIVSDGWSIGVLVRELIATYTARDQGGAVELPALAVQYADYAAWERDWLNGDRLQQELAYWKERLSGSTGQLAIPTDRPRPPVQTFRGAHHRFVWPRKVHRALHEAARQSRATLFMVITAGLSAVLSRWTGQCDISLGTPVANRRAEVEGLIGLFVNTLVLRADVSGNPSFRELIGRTRATTLGAYAHQDVPFEMVVEAVAPHRDLSRSPLFQMMIELNNTPGVSLDTPHLKLEALAADDGISRFDLTMELAEEEDGIRGSIEYNTDLFDEATIARLAQSLEEFLWAACLRPEQRISEFPIMTVREQQEILVEWNRSEREIPVALCAHELFEHQVREHPDAVAVSFEGQQLSYSELDRRANRLAHYLRKLEAGPEDLVAVCFERSLEVVIAVLAVLKAGSAFVPLDARYPSERLNYMLRDSRSKVLLTERRLVDQLSTDGTQVVCVDSDWPRIAGESADRPESHVTPENLAYVIYTSGSTGRPKGTMLRHSGLVNLAIAQRHAFDIRPGKRVLQFAPLSFDASVWEIFMALGNGAQLCLVPQERLSSPEDLHSVLQQLAITTATLPPSMLEVLSNDSLDALQTVISAGEACSRRLAERWSKGRSFFNAYGPTETTVCASMSAFDSEQARTPAIGRAIANCQTYILDQRLQPVPVGVVGELYVGGAGVARGYLGRAELTAQKFVADPFSPTAGARLYRTGDLARWRNDSQMEFIGRTDEQVKVRGHRVELGEIEDTLKRCPCVTDCAVIVNEGGLAGARIVAYVVGENADFASVRAQLKERLPEYMVPSLFVQLERLPLTANGKVDRRALPRPDEVEHGNRSAYIAPRTSTEEQLVAIWEELLQTGRISVDDDFFESGGHSLLATQVMSRVRERLYVDVPLRAVFEHPTVSSLAIEIDAYRKSIPDGVAVDELISSVSAMSDEEVATLLSVEEQKKALAQ